MLSFSTLKDKRPYRRGTDYKKHLIKNSILYEEIKLDLKQKRVLVTGACGTVGKELVRQLLNGQKVAELIALDNNESELFAL